MNTVTPAVVSVLLAVAGLAPITCTANADEECGSTAKSIFSIAGTLVSDGGRHAAVPPKPKDKPAFQRCRIKESPQAMPVTVSTPVLHAVVPHSGLAFWVETLRCGAATSRRTTEYRFITGDCAKLFFMPNVEGYLYVANVDSNNKVDYLYPQRGENNHLRAGDDANFGVEFVGAPGIESVFVFFSKTKIADVAGLTMGLARKAAVISRPVEQVYSVSLANARGQTGNTKSLRRTDEVVALSTPDAARYVVVDDSELASLPIMVINLDLVHTSQ